METIRAILQYYAIISISCLTLNVPLVVILYRKTKFFDHVNNYMDAMLGIKPDNNPKEKEQNAIDSQENQGQNKQQDPSVQAVGRPEESGISSFRMKVGTSYFCKLSSQNRFSKTYEIEWFSDNEFVGTIDEKKGLFRALRAGKVSIGFEIKAAGSDSGTMLYEIEVVPDEQDWYAGELIEDLIARKRRDIVLSRFADRNIEYDNQDKNIIGYGTDEFCLSLQLQFNKYDELERVLYELPPMSPKGRTEFVKQVEQRFEKIETTGYGIHIWNMRLEDQEKNEVILYAFIRQTEDNRSYFGIGQFWREYGEEDEMLENIQMVEGLFCDLLPDITPAEVKARKKMRKKPVQNYEPEEENDTVSKPGENTSHETEPGQYHEEPEEKQIRYDHEQHTEVQDDGKRDDTDDDTKPDVSEEGPDDLDKYADFDTAEMINPDEENEE